MNRYNNWQRLRRNMKSQKTKSIVLLVLFILNLLCFSSILAIDRRKEQFLAEPSYLILPFPYNIPGFGSGVVVTGLAANIGGT